VFDTSEPDDMTAYSDALPKLVSIGVQVPVNYAHEKLGIPKPENGEAILKPPSPPADPAALSTRQYQLAALNSRLPLPQTALDSVLDQIPPEVQQQQAEAMLAALIARINGGDSLEALQDDLSDLYPALDTGGIEELLTRLFFVAETWGRLNV
jgi:phage gp29-like protein